MDMRSSTMSCRSIFTRCQVALPPHSLFYHSVHTLHYSSQGLSIPHTNWFNITSNKYTTMGPTTNAAVGGGKFVGIGLFLFACLGLALLYPYNAIISATDWFEYVMPNSQNISGALANANFIASLVRTAPSYHIVQKCYTTYYSFG